MLETGFIDKIYFRYWRAEKPAASVIAIHGFGGHSIWFDKAGGFFNKNNISFFSFDLPGFGQSKYERGDVDSYMTWVNVAKSVFEHYKENHSKGKKVFIMGHSMGSLLTIMTNKEVNSDGIVLSVPGFDGSKEAWPLKLVLSIMFNSIFSPQKPITVPFGPELLTRSREAQLECKKDPYRVISPKAKVFLQLKLLGMAAKKTLPKIKTPVFLIKAEKDMVCSNEAMDLAYKEILSSDKQIKEYKDFYHDLFLEEEQEEVVGDISTWIFGRT